MDAKILDQVTANTVGNCKIMTTSLIMATGVKYTISNISFVPQAVVCARNRNDEEWSTTIIKPMTANYVMRVNEWGIDFITVSTGYGYGDTWYFIILGY